MIVILSGPSGAGEDSIIKGLQKIMPIKRIVTTTTRTMRPGESEGNPYHFVTKEQFEKDLAHDKFFEHAKQYNDQLYGVTFNAIRQAQESADIYIWKIDYKGVQNAKKILPNAPAILITAPLRQLEARIRGRGGMSDKQIQERMAYSKEWFKHKNLYDHAIDNSNGKLKQSIKQIQNLLLEYQKTDS